MTSTIIVSSSSKTLPSTGASCAICGDTTGTGTHYRVRSCEACRSFFKGNSRKLNKFTCTRKTGNCPIDFTTRKCCPRCRLLKSLSLGMRLTRREDLLKNNSIPPSVTTVISLDDLLNQTITVELQKSTSQNQTDEHLLKATPTVYPRKKFPTALSHFEKQPIGELQSALSSCFTAEHLLPCAGHFATLSETYNWPAVYSKRVSRFCRSLPAFNSIPSFADQLVILRSAYLYVLSMRAFFAYDHALGGYYILADESGNESLFLSASLAEGHYKGEWMEESNRMLRQFQTVMEDDEVIRDLLIGFFLFRGSPLYRKCSSKSLELVTYQQQRYLHLLYRYLVHKWAHLGVAGRKYSTILNVIDTFEKLTARSKALLQDVDVSLFSDLLKEIYEL